MLVTAVHAAAQPALQHGAAPRACCAARCSPAGVPATPPKLTGHSRLSPPPPLPQSSLSAASLVIWLVRLDRSLCTLASSLRSATLSARAAAGGRGAMHRMGGGGGGTHIMIPPTCISPRAAQRRSSSAQPRCAAGRVHARVSQVAACLSAPAPLPSLTPAQEPQQAQRWQRRRWQQETNKDKVHREGCSQVDACCSAASAASFSEICCSRPLTSPFRPSTAAAWVRAGGGGAVRCRTKAREAGSSRRRRHRRCSGARAR